MSEPTSSRSQQKRIAALTKGEPDRFAATLFLIAVAETAKLPRDQKLRDHYAEKLQAARLELTEARERERVYREALERINDVRNSLVGYQGFNFSMHAYPLVAALDAVGITGLSFEEARARLKEIDTKIHKWEVEANAKLAEVAKMGG